MTSVLVVDDHPAVRTLVGRWLGSAGFDSREATTAEEALAIMSDDPAPVALCDITMPGHDGLWLAEQLRRHYPKTALIMATGQDSSECVITSLRTGVLDYLVKPFKSDRLLQAVERGVRWHQEAVAVDERLSRLEQEAEGRRQQLAEALGMTQINSRATVRALLAMLTLHDPDAYQHGLRVAALSVAIAKDLGIGEPTLEQLEVGALLHDVGKVAVPCDVLAKPARLTEFEIGVMQSHANWGGRIMRSVPFLAGSAVLVESSHERFDGSGYPRGMRGEEIPVAARILAVADSYDAMTSPRPYRDLRPSEDAVDEVIACQGTLYDPQVVGALQRVVHEFVVAMPRTPSPLIPF